MRGNRNPHGSGRLDVNLNSSRATKHISFLTGETLTGGWRP